MKDDQYNNDSEYTSNQDDFTSTSHVNEQNTDSKQEVESIDHYDTEFTADAPAINPHESSRSEVRKYDKRTNMKVRAQHGWGWLALSVAVISFFIWTIFFAIIGGVLGVYAIRKNSLILGNACHYIIDVCSHFPTDGKPNYLELNKQKAGNERIFSSPALS